MSGLDATGLALKHERTLSKVPAPCEVVSFSITFASINEPLDTASACHARLNRTAPNTAGRRTPRGMIVRLQRRAIRGMIVRLQRRAIRGRRVLLISRRFGVVRPA
jgi:hypothetical protein